MEPTVEIDQLSKRFGPIQAVDNVSFSVKKGEVLGFLGPNGAGKSTTMKMVTGFITPTSGTAKVCGFDILQQSMAVRRHIGYLPEGAPAYPDMTAKSFLGFVAEVRGLKGKQRSEAIEKAVERAQISGVLNQQIETLSKGFKRRVGLAQAILHDPNVLILDEPTDGLDPNQKYEVRQLISNMAAEKIIILSTHILEEVEAVCSRAIIIAKGKKIFDGTPAELEAKSDHHNAVTVRLKSDSSAAAEKAVSGLADVESVKTHRVNGSTTLTVLPKDGASIISHVAALTRENDWGVEEIYAERGRLDEVFRKLTRQENGGS